MFMDLSQKNVLFIGGGNVNAFRVNAILEFAGHVTVVAPEAHDYIAALAQREMITWHRKRFAEDDLDDADIAIISTGHPGTDVRIAGMCRRRGILVNAESDQSLCDFYFPGIARKDPLVVGVSASGEDDKMQAQVTEYFRRLLKKD